MPVKTYTCPRVPVKTYTRDLLKDFPFLRTWVYKGIIGAPHQTHPPTRSRVAANFRRLLLEKGHRKKDLALESGVSRSIMDRIEDGDCGVTIDVLGRLATAMGRDVSEFFVLHEPSVLTGTLTD